jgi:hypothetical protein
MSIIVTLNVDGPRDPGYVLEVAEAVPEAVRVINHLTRDHAALREPAEVDRLLRYLESAADRHDQLLSQIISWLEEEQAAGGVRVTGGEYRDNPAGAITRIRARLDTAKFAAEMLRAALDDAAMVTSDLAAGGEG